MFGNTVKLVVHSTTRLAYHVHKVQRCGLLTTASKFSPSFSAVHDQLPQLNNSACTQHKKLGKHLAYGATYHRSFSKNNKQTNEDFKDEDDEWDPDEVRIEMMEAMERLEMRLAKIRSGHNQVDTFNSVSQYKWVQFCSESMFRPTS